MNSKLLIPVHGVYNNIIALATHVVSMQVLFEGTFIIVFVFNILAALFFIPLLLLGYEVTKGNPYPTYKSHRIIIFPYTYFVYKTVYD